MPKTLDDIVLGHGSHNGPEEGMCAMEAAAYIADEPFSDHPQCVSPAIAAFMRSWNDSLDEENRNRILKPYIEKVIGTRTTDDAIEHARGWMCVQWMINHYAPAWLDLAGLNEHATALRSLKIDNMDDLNAAAETCSAAYSAADSAAYSAAYDVLAPVVVRLQQSACEPLDRMIAVGAK